MHQQEVKNGENTTYCVQFIYSSLQMAIALDNKT